MNKLVLSSDQVRQIEEEGSQAYPNECCGIMIGRDVSDGACTRRIVERLVTMANAWDAAEQRRRFAIDPLALMRAEKSAADEGQIVLGFYHSHPDHPARPSETDRQYGWPFYSYVIVSIAQGRAADMTSWVLDEQTESFSRQDIEAE
ncbi:MAG TPA: M67 family metallopeptidase [Tepidisphaeraceae bacterium]|jgi:proteasome lid subunit RPN8/RPN11